MKALSLTLSLSLLAFAYPSIASAQTLLQNDAFDDPSDPVIFQSGFAAGEMGAVRLDPGSGTYKVLNVQLLFGGDTTTETITLNIWSDIGTDDPGTPLYSGDFQLQGSDSSLQLLDIASENVLVSGPFRVGIELQHAGYPAFAKDDDGLTAAANFLFLDGSGWMPSSDSGDWIIRATVEEDTSGGGEGGAAGAPGTGGSAGSGSGGTSAGADGGQGGSDDEPASGGDPGTGEAGSNGQAGSNGEGGESSSGGAGSGGTGATTNAAQSESDSDSGCGCRLPSARSNAAAYAWLLGLAILSRRVRPRRRSTSARE